MSQTCNLEHQHELHIKTCYDTLQIVFEIQSKILGPQALNLKTQIWRKINNKILVLLQSYVGWSFNLFMATTGDVWIIRSFQIWDHVMHIEYVSCIITNCGQHQWMIPSPLSIALYPLQCYQKITIPAFRILLEILIFQVAFLIFLFITIFSLYFLLVGLLLQSVTLFQSRKYLESL